MVTFLLRCVFRHTRQRRLSVPHHSPTKPLSGLRELGELITRGLAFPKNMVLCVPQLHGRQPRPSTLGQTYHHPHRLAAKIFGSRVFLASTLISFWLLGRLWCSLGSSTLTPSTLGLNPRPTTINAHVTDVLTPLRANHRARSSGQLKLKSLA